MDRPMHGGSGSAWFWPARRDGSAHGEPSRSAEETSGYLLHLEHRGYAHRQLRPQEAFLKQGLVSADRQGKERLYEASEAGREASIRFREVRDACLIGTLTALGTVDTQEIGDAARVLRALSGLYDQAARAATSL